MSRSSVLAQTVQPSPPEGRLRASHWLVLAAALLGSMFDGLEIGLFSVVGRPALRDLLGKEGHEGEVAQWLSYIIAAFLLGAAVGGVLFGWLGDRVGRVRAMVLCILTFSGFIRACYFVTAPWQLCVLQFLAALGMGGEWSLGVALVVEYCPERYRACCPAWSVPPAMWAT